jgi:hypothetical protein
LAEGAIDLITAELQTGKSDRTSARMLAALVRQRQEAQEDVYS